VVTILGQSWVRILGVVLEMGDKKIKRKSGHNIDWTDIPLGTDTDAAIAQTYGLKPQTVANARRMRSIPSYKPYSKAIQKVDWDDEPRLGKMPDRMLQRLLGAASSASVTAARQRRGIPKFVRPSADDMLLVVREVQQLVEGAKAGTRPPMVAYELLEAILMQNNLLPKGKKK